MTNIENHAMLDVLEWLLAGGTVMELAEYNIPPKLTKKRGAYCWS